MHATNIHIFDDSGQAAAAAGDALIACAQTGGNRPIGLATGQTMTPLYDHLLKIENQENSLFASTVFSQLDEIIGRPSPVASFAHELTTSLFSNFRTAPAGFLMIDGQAGDPASEAVRHCHAIRKAGGLAMQLLGIGVNGHVGFNEPGSSHDSRCTSADITKEEFSMRYLHTMVRITDVDASLHFYCDLLGLEIAKTIENEKGRYTIYFLSTPNDRQRYEETRSPALELTYNWDAEDYTGGRNFGHLAYRVDDIYALCEKLMAAGVTINRPPRDGNMAFVRSPDGISVELLQEGDPLDPAEPWQSMGNTGSW